MTNGKILELIKALLRGTVEGRVVWEDLAEEEMFRTQRSGGLIRIGKAEDESKKGYTFWLMGFTGTVAAEVNFFPGDSGFEPMEQLYSAARLAARGGEQIIDNIIRELNPIGK